ncbi:hypothetical protein [Haliangium sp.]|uniref:hypothetical protein n=1 Tax=Haliangium sp. TaxID=2663208 RepID=UPI003D0C683C
MSNKSGWYQLGTTSDFRLDVDGHFPQSAMGWSYHHSQGLIHYVGELSSTGANVWETTSLEAITSLYFPDISKIRATYKTAADGSPGLDLLFLKADGSTFGTLNGLSRVSESFHALELEFDYASGTAQVLEFGTHEHPNHPADLPQENLSVAEVFRRAGFDVSVTNGANAVPTAAAGADAAWTNAELHDAMDAHWSRDEEAWKMWVFHANGDHADGNLEGIMFDGSGAFQRSGVAIFPGNIFAPIGDPAPAAYRRRLEFFDICHEMGHALNLFHSWIKTSGTRWKSDVQSNAEARSYMNYEYRVNGGQQSFFSTFRYRFTDDELLFLRCAPGDYVTAGGAAFGIDHAKAPLASDLNLDVSDQFSLVVRVNKAAPIFEFMEPVTIELELTNSSDKPKKVNPRALDDIAHMRIGVRHNGGTVKTYRPYATPCPRVEPIELQPGQSLYGSVFLSAGSGGWLVAEPGTYEVSVLADIDGEHGEGTALSNLLRFAVKVPAADTREARRQQETLAQDYFRDDVGRTLAFMGSKRLGVANDTLREVLERHAQSKAAVHAELALNLPDAGEYKLLEFDEAGDKRIVDKAPRAQAAAAAQRVLTDKADVAAETLGHIGLNKTSAALGRALARAGDKAGAKAVRQGFLDTMQRRGVKLPDQVKQRVADEIATFGKR